MASKKNNYWPVILLLAFLLYRTPVNQYNDPEPQVPNDNL